MRGRVVLGCLLWLYSVPTWATVYWIDDAGSNGNACSAVDSVDINTDPGTYKQTIANGISCLSAGDTLAVKAGIYLNETIQNVPSGSGSTYTIIRGDPAGARPIIASSIAFHRGLITNGAGDHHWEIRGFHFSGTAGTDFIHECWADVGAEPADMSHHIRFIDNLCHDTTNTGIIIFGDIAGVTSGDHYIAENEFYNIGIGTPGYHGMNCIYGTGNRTIIEDNSFHNLTNGVAIFTGGVTFNDVIVRNNILYDIGRADIDTWQCPDIGSGSCYNGTVAIAVTTLGSGHLIYNNIIYNIGADNSGSLAAITNPYGIATYNNPSGAGIYHNTLYHSFHSGGVGIDGGGADASGIICRNNIAFDFASGIQGCDTTSNNLTTDPTFVNANGADFHLMTGSAARNAGFDLFAIVPTDYDGLPRDTVPDLGALEFVEPGVPPVLGGTRVVLMMRSMFGLTVSHLLEGLTMLHTLLGLLACAPLVLGLWRARSRIIWYGKRAYLFVLTGLLRLKRTEPDTLTVAGALEEAESILREDMQHTRT